jgi:anti-anti-sigma factor
VSPEFRIALDAAQDRSPRVVLDLEALTLIDCAGLSVLFAAAERSRREGALLILLDTRGQVRRVLHLTGAPAGVAILDASDLSGLGALEAA